MAFTNTGPGRQSGDLRSQTRAGYIVPGTGGRSGYAPGTQKGGMIESNVGGGAALPGGTQTGGTTVRYGGLNNKVGTIVRVRG